MRRHHNNEKDQGHQHRGGSNQIGSGKGEMLGQHTTGEDADAQTEVPGGEIGGGGSASLGVGAEIDEECVERGERRTETQATT